MKSTLFVTAQFLLIGAIALYTRGSSGGGAQNVIMIIGVLLGLRAIATMKLRVNILPDVRENQELYTSGPYQYIRHPMYTAVLLVTLSWIMNRLDVVSIGLWLILLIVLVQKLSYEERLLAKKFKKYKSYLNKTNRLVPFVY